MAQVASLRSDAPVEDEEDRLESLRALDVLDSPSELAYERIVRLIKLSLGVETAIVSFMDGHRQWYKAAEGTPNHEVPLSETFCRTLIDEPVPLIVPDASVDPRFAANPHVTPNDGVRFYAGAPIRTRSGQVIGSVCALDTAPRVSSGNEGAILTELADVVLNQIELSQMATVDSLTGSMSRRAFKDALVRHVELARRHHNSLSVVTFDIDHFKVINDTYGHAAGDRVLADIVGAAKAELRRSDMLGRMGGEEFAIILSFTAAERAFDVAEKLRRLFKALEFPQSHPPITATASFGVAALDAATDDADSLLVKADEALYQSKRSGRNRTTLWQSSGAEPQSNRRRVLKAGKLVFNNRFSAVDCTVKWLSDTGAEVQVSASLGIPDVVHLVIKSDGIEKRCEVEQRTETRLILKFVG